MRALDRFFVGAMTAAVVYFLGDSIGNAVLNGHQALQTVVVAVLTLVYFPAFPLVALVPSIPPTVALAFACLAWGGLLQLYHVAYHRVRSRRLTSA